MSARLKTFFGVSFVICCTVLLQYLGALRIAEQYLRRLINPTSAALYHWTIRLNEGPEESFSSPAELQAAYQAAKEQLARAGRERVRADALEEENKHLRALLRFFEKKPFQSVGAQVIGRNIEPVGNTLILDQGSRAGIAIGRPVVADDGIFIGEIVRADPDTSVVQLISDGKSKVAATVLNHDRSIGIVEGGYGVSVRMTFIPQNETIAIGDVIVTSGLESGIPRGLAIGRVEAVEKEAYQPFQQAVLTTETNLDKITAVSVIVATSSAQNIL